MGTFRGSSFPEPMAPQSTTLSLRDFTSEAVPERPKQLQTLVCAFQRAAVSLTQPALLQEFALSLAMGNNEAKDGDSRAIRITRGRVTTLPHAQGWRPFPNMGNKFIAILKFILLLAAISATRALAAVHPVPLEKNVDAAKCIECHLIMPRLNSELTSFGSLFNDCCS